jgi:hypothetical protein
MVDGGGSSAGEGWGIDDDLMVVPVRLEEGRSGLLPAMSLLQLDRGPLSGRTARHCDDGFRTATQAWRSGATSASGRAGPDRGVGPVLDRGCTVGSRTHGGQVEGVLCQAGPRRGEETLTGGSHVTATFQFKSNSKTKWHRKNS